MQSSVKVFGPVKPQSVPVFASLAYNPQTQLGDDFGTKVSNLDSAHKQVKHAYAPETILEALQQLWLTGGVQNPINRRQASAVRRIILQKNAGKRKRNETKQLNEALLLSELKNIGFSPAQAKQVISHDSKGWSMQQDSESGPDLILTVFRPGQTEPVISDKFEKAYKQLAVLWKQEFSTHEPKTPIKVARYTRQQEKTEADAAQKHELQGFNAVQEKQMQDMLAKALRPVIAAQEQQQSDMKTLQQNQDTLTELTKQQQLLWGRALPVFDRMSAQLPCIGWQNAPEAAPGQGPAPLNTQHDSCDGSQAS